MVSKEKRREYIRKYRSSEKGKLNSKKCRDNQIKKNPEALASARLWVGV